METKHSPTPWVNDMGYISSVPENDLVTIAVQRNSGFIGMQANAARIVACVNACEGVDTEDLTHGCYQKLIEKHVEVCFAKQDLEAQRDELLAALKNCIAAIERTDHYTQVDRFEAADKARVAIAKADGRGHD